MKSIIPHDNLQELIYLIRGRRVMLDRDLAALYGVPTGVLNQAVKRNQKRFPDDFMFQLNSNEVENWISQIVISNPALKMSLRKRPFAFTEHGVAMLSSVLKSERAVQVNIAIVRAFIDMRRMISETRGLAEKLVEHEKKFIELTNDVRHLYQLIKDMSQSPQMEGIGFQLDPEK